MLLAISGAQGTGKSTLIQALVDQKICQSITRKTSRSILSDWGVTLDQVNADKDLCAKFQREIINRKYEDEKFAIASSDIWVTERSYADLFTYATISLGGYNVFDEWLNDYYQACVDLQAQYAGVILLQGGLFDPVYDGVRAINVHYARLVDQAVAANTHRMSERTSAKVTTICPIDLDGRVDVVKYVMQELGPQ